MALTLAGTPAINGLSVPTDSITPGMVLVNKTDFSATTAVSVNSCFTSAYENYRVVVNVATSTAAANSVNLRLRASGVDLSSAVYTASYLYNTHLAGPSRGYGSGLTGLELAYVEDYRAGISADFFGPQVADRTSLVSHHMTFGSGGVSYSGFFGGFVNNALQYDGFTLYPGTGTITGTVRVYGLRNA